ncbi:unnamed protein product [Peniophora sp. CBMAI 1063]|nr:unnamed protein product [Peniophora sp. CBMAI 1063]
MPAELLAEVFHLATFTRSYSDRKTRQDSPLPTLFTIARVCVHWAKTIIRCSSLWDVAASFARSEKARRRLLLRSTSNNLHFSSFGTALTEAVIRGVPFIRSLEAFSNYPFWTRLLDPANHFDNLEFLWLQRFGPNTRRPRPVLNAPRLSTLRTDVLVDLRGSALRTLIFGVRTLTTSECLVGLRDLLAQSPGLQILHIERQTDGAYSDSDWANILLPLSGGLLQELYVLDLRTRGEFVDTPAILLPHLRKLVSRLALNLRAPLIEDASISDIFNPEFRNILCGISHAFSLTVLERSHESHATYSIDFDHVQRVHFHRLSTFTYLGDMDTRLLAMMRIIQAPWHTVNLTTSVATSLCPPVYHNCHEVNERGDRLRENIHRLFSLRTFLESATNTRETVLCIELFADVKSIHHRIRFKLLCADAVNNTKTASSLDIPPACVNIDAHLRARSCRDTHRGGFKVTASYVLTAVALKSVSSIRMDIHPASGCERHQLDMPLRYDQTWTLPDPVNLPELEDANLLRDNLLNMPIVQHLRMTLLRWHEDHRYTMLHVLASDVQRALLPLLTTLRIDGMRGAKSLRIGVGSWWEDLMQIAALRPDVTIVFSGNVCMCKNTDRIRAKLRALQKLVRIVEMGTDDCDSCD